MKKLYIAFIVVFAVLLILPFSVQTVADLRGEKRFVSLDIFKDIVYTPFARESKMAESAAKLNEAWFAARESIAGGAEVGESLEGVVSALSDLEAVALTVNSYAELDTVESDYKLLKHADTLVAALEDEPETFKSVDSTLKAVVAEFGQFSLWRALCGIKHYGVWTSRYLRAFENKVEDENALVLAFRPKYQLAVWNIFNDPGEKVVLGSGSGRWLFYRQDVEFLVQPSPLDVRSAKLDNPIQAILKFREQLKAKGVELLVVITPGKPSIYPERLTGVDGLKLAGHGKAILDSLTRLGLNTVDLYTPLLAAKADDASLGALYLDDDTHWTPRGAELAAGEIAKKVNSMADAGIIDIGEPSMNYVLSDSLADRMGDIGEMSGLNKFNVFKAQQVTGHVIYQQEISERTEPPQDSLLDSTVVRDTVKTPFKDDFRKSRILILGDSFSRIYQTDAPVNAGWIAHFAKNISRPVASIVSDGGASTLVREKLARKAGVLKGKKLLIWEFVERDLRFGAEGWKTIEF
ncbi:alginate O-acetyltransferase AlgX-related protein [Fibrobacter sp.]|uniref:alginate O-acetyltransferase AlgX-related protein n=1 Tax=Fibrobacter sp. TaxID=35828 RepID=UPI00388D579E